MKAVVLEKACADWEFKYVENAPKPAAPGPGEVLIRVKASSLNAADYKMAAWGSPAWAFPHIPGMDVSGTIEEVGVGVTTLQRGDEVFGCVPFTRQGALAEFVVEPARGLAKKPRGVTHYEAAAIPTAGFTAAYALFHKVTVKPGNTVVILGGSSGVGSFAIQLAAMTGCVVIATASGANQEYIRDLGATHCIDYTKGNVVAEVMALTSGKGADVVLDIIGGQSAVEALSLAKVCGHVVCITGLPDMTKYAPFSKGISVHEELENTLGCMGAHLVQLVAAGKLDACIGKQVPLAAAPEALKQMSQHHTKGKIVISVL